MDIDVICELIKDYEIVVRIWNLDVGLYSLYVIII